MFGSPIFALSVRFWSKLDARHAPRRFSCSAGVGLSSIGLACKKFGFDKFELVWKSLIPEAYKNTRTNSWAAFRHLETCDK